MIQIQKITVDVYSPETVQINTAVFNHDSKINFMNAKRIEAKVVATSYDSIKNIESIALSTKITLFDGSIPQNDLIIESRDAYPSVSIYIDDKVNAVVKGKTGEITYSNGKRVTFPFVSYIPEQSSTASLAFSKDSTLEIKPIELTYDEPVLMIIVQDCKLVFDDKSEKKKPMCLLSLLGNAELESKSELYLDDFEVSGTGNKLSSVGPIYASLNVKNSSTIELNCPQNVFQYLIIQYNSTIKSDNILNIDTVKLEDKSYEQIQINIDAPINITNALTYGSIPLYIRELIYNNHSYIRQFYYEEGTFPVEIKKATKINYVFSSNKLKNQGYNEILFDNLFYQNKNQFKAIITDIDINNIEYIDYPTDTEIPALSDPKSISLSKNNNIIYADLVYAPLSYQLTFCIGGKYETSKCSKLPERYFFSESNDEWKNLVKNYTKSVTINIESKETKFNLADFYYATWVTITQTSNSNLSLYSSKIYYKTLSLSLTGGKVDFDINQSDIRSSLIATNVNLNIINARQLGMLLRMLLLSNARVHLDALAVLKTETIAILNNTVIYGVYFNAKPKQLKLDMSTIKYANSESLVNLKIDDDIEGIEFQEVGFNVLCEDGKKFVNSNIAIINLPEKPANTIFITSTMKSIPKYKIYQLLNTNSYFFKGDFPKGNPFILCDNSFVNDRLNIKIVTDKYIPIQLPDDFEGRNVEIKSLSGDVYFTYPIIPEKANFYPYFSINNNNNVHANFTAVVRSGLGFKPKGNEKFILDNFKANSDGGKQNRVELVSMTVKDAMVTDSLVIGYMTNFESDKVIIKSQKQPTSVKTTGNCTIKEFAYDSSIKSDKPEKIFCCDGFLKVGKIYKLNNAKNVKVDGKCIVANSDSSGSDDDNDNDADKSKSQKGLMIAAITVGILCIVVIVGIIIAVVLMKKHKRRTQESTETYATPLV